MKVKNFFLIAVSACLFLQAVSAGTRRVAAGPAVSYDGPHLKLDTAVLDLGFISADRVAVGKMGFLNDGTAPLVIRDVFTDCGCTVPSYSRDTVMPGARGTVTIRFNGRGREPGAFRKAVRIRSNAVNSHEFFSVVGTLKRVYHK